MRAELLAHLSLAADRYGEAVTIPAPVPVPEQPVVTPTPALGTPAPAKAKAATEKTPPPQPQPGATPTLLADLAATLANCTKCKLASNRTNVVFGEGSPNARVMFIGEAPGFHEDKQGRPFVGPAGQLLDRIIENAMGLQRSEVYIANVNKCRPPNNRDPEPDEVAACLPHLREQVRSIKPEVIVTLGRIAAQNLLSTDAPMKRLRGQELSHEGIPVVATWHPAYLLRNPAAKPETWEDIKRVNRLLGHPERPEPRRPGGSHG